MNFLSSLLGAFLGAFFVVFWKVYVENNSRVLLAYEDTCSTFSHANKDIFENCCSDPFDPMTFDPPMEADVSYGLAPYFEKKYLRYTGLYSEEIQAKIDDLRAIYLSNGDPEMLVRHDKNGHCKNYDQVNSILLEVPQLCESEMKLRRKNLPVFIWFRLKKQFATSR